MIAALLIGREGSLAFPGKNIYPVLNHPLMEYPLLAAMNSPSVDEVYVSTDSEKVKEIAKKNNACVIDRPAYLCTHEALGEDAFVHGYNYIKGLGKDIELMVLLFCNAPCVLPGQIEEAIGVLRSREGFDSAVTVSRYNMYSPARARRITEDGLLQPFIPFEAYSEKMRITCDRDSQGDVYFADVCLSVVRPKCLENIKAGLLPQKWMGKKIYPIKQWGGCDVDYEWQIPMVEFWLKSHISLDGGQISYKPTKVKGGNKLVSVVIPAMNEENNIGAVLDDLSKVFNQASSYQFETIVVDDHSKDKTASIAMSRNVKVLSNHRPPGKGHALITGFENANGDYIVMMDADYSHRPEDIPDLLKILEGGAGLAIGSRIYGGSDEYTRIRAFGNIVLTMLFGIFHKRYLSDALNGFKAFKAEIFKNFRYTSRDFEIEIELLVNTLRSNMDIAETPSHERTRMHGTSKSKILKHGFNFLIRIITEWFRNKTNKPY